MVTELARLYSEAFAPEYFVLLCTIALVGHEWRRRRFGPAGLAGRALAVVAGWAVAFAIYESTGAVFESVPSWGEDFTGSVGLGVGILLIGIVWRLREWGRHVPRFAALLLGVTVVHVAITPFWDVSSHVAYAVAPAGYLVSADRRFWPLLAVAIGMVAARPLAGAHTWLQSIGGFALAAAFIAGLSYRVGRTGGAAAPDRATAGRE
ncbi:hypothetical protein [Halorussus marinus]|uniref:hypothetical protein n=1 Tax=Halorussus marinus TaxID=2505976 RepID=UPI001B2FF3F0|nr:hypothetical protein [Halorussus marinus]